MERKIELLAPAGSRESLIAAVRCGADAVYLGAKQFSARQNADNFSIEELQEMTAYCHLLDKKVYLTLNTLLRDDERKQALKLVEDAVLCRIDAVIVQDIGFASLLRKAVPELRLHASTQMTIHTPAGVRALAKMGFSRVVLSRELSRNEIREIAESSPIELEIFVHGAHCMSVSGQCYLSAMLGGRSGNRGRCAQPCRLPFSIDGGNGYALSLRDLSLIHKIEEIEKIGVASIKIEGRMKRPEYVAAAVDACRDAIDHKRVSLEKIERLRAVFSRSGFTDGYYTGNRGSGMFGARRKEDVLSATKEIFSEIRKSYHKEKQQIPVSFCLTVKEGKNSVLTVTDEKGNTARTEGPVPEKAKTDRDETEAFKLKLEKLGGTPFFCQKSKINTDGGLFLSFSSIGEMRSRVLSYLAKKREQNQSVPCFQLPDRLLLKESRHRAEKEIKLRARVTDIKTIPDSFSKMEFVFVPIHSKPEELKILSEKRIRPAIELPRAMFGREQELFSLLKKHKEAGIDDVWAGTIGAVELAKELHMTIHGGFSLNLTNTSSLLWAQEAGLCDVETSFELTLAQTASLGGTIKRGIIAAGKLPLMLMRNCPGSLQKGGCGQKKGTVLLTDRKNMHFPISCDTKSSELLNAVDLYLGDQLHKIRGIDFLVLRFTVENSVETGEKFLNFHNRNKPNLPITRGLSVRGVD